MDSAPSHEPPLEQECERFWRRNLLVCVFGSFTTVLAMTLLLPFLPLYVASLGVRDRGAVAQWSGIAFGATFLASGLAAPLWGRVADRTGRKPILVRASLGMAVCMALTGTVQDIWELLALRLLTGLLGGYASGSTLLVATQTPRRRSAWALGVLSSGVMAGGVAGPLLGGVLPPLIGVRRTFFLAGGVIFLAFLATVMLIREERPPRVVGPRQGAWAVVPDRRAVLAMLLTGTLLTLANMSIEPIVTLYVAQLLPPGGPVTVMSGLIMAAAALGSVLAAPPVGRIADRIGHRRVVVAGLLACALLLLPQASVTGAWQLLGLRFLMGVALAGLSPALTSMIRHSVPAAAASRILSLNTSAQYVGFVAGPLLGGVVAAHLGMRPVFGVTSLVMLAGAGLAFTLRDLPPAR